MRDNKSNCRTKSYTKGEENDYKKSRKQGNEKGGKSYNGKDFYLQAVREATNNLSYWRLLARANSLTPIDCFLLQRKDAFGVVKDVWDKEVICSYDVVFTPTLGSIECIAFNVSGMERPRRTFDQWFDNISHIKTCVLTKDKVSTKYLICKPLSDMYRQMKDRTQGRINAIYEKNFLNLNK